MPRRAKPSVDLLSLAWVEDPLELIGFQFQMRRLLLQSDPPGYLPKHGCATDHDFVARKFGIEVGRAQSLLDQLFERGGLARDERRRLCDTGLIKLHSEWDAKLEANRRRAIEYRLSLKDPACAHEGRTESAREAHGPSPGSPSPSPSNNSPSSDPSDPQPDLFAGQTGNSSGKKRVRKPRAKPGTAHQNLDRECAPYRQLTNHWCMRKREIVPTYKFIQEDGVHLAKVWERVDRNLLMAKAVIDQFMADGIHGHSSKSLRTLIESYMERVLRSQGVSHARAKLTASQRGEFDEHMPIPINTYSGRGGEPAAAAGAHRTADRPGAGGEISAEAGGDAAIAG